MAQIKLAEYTFDNSVEDCLPALTPNTITMTKEDTVSGTTTKRIVYIDNSVMPRQISFYWKKSLLTLDYLNMGTNITSMYQMFFCCTSVTMINCTGWDTSNVTDMYQLFNTCPKLREIKSLETINTSKITNMGWLFRSCDLVDISGIANWDVSKVTIFERMFENNPNLKTVDVSGWTTTSCANMGGMFSNCPSLTKIKGIETLDVSKATSFSSMFDGCSSLTKLDLSSWDTSSCTSIYYMFDGCGVATLNLKGWDTSKVKDMQKTFSNMKNITTLDLSHFDTSNVDNMQYVISNCPKLTYIDVSSFTRKASSTNINYLFLDNLSLESIDISNFDMTNMSTYMFRNSSKLKTIGMLYSSAESINKLVASGFSNYRDGITIYYYDADTSQLTPVEGVTFKKYAMSTTIQLPPHIQLHSLPDGTRDEVDIKTGILTRNVGRVVLDGTQTVEDNGNFLYISNLLPDYNGIAISDSEKLFITNTEIKANNKHNGIYISNTGTLRIRTKEIYAGQSSTEFKKYLQSKPTTIYYSTSNSTTEQLILNYNNSCNYGRILPTGMCDKYDVVNSMYTQTMTSILLDGANAWDAMEEFENTVKFTATGTTVGVENLNMLGAGGLYCDNDLFPNINDDSDVEHCRVDEAGNKFYIYISKDRLMSSDLIGWQIWLQANPFNLIYELAEHLTYVKPYEELDATQARWEGMDCMRDGTIKYHTNNEDNLTIYPTLEYVAPSINNFEVTMLEPNTDYTIYAEGINTNDTINFGGTDINFNNGTVVTSGDNQWLRIDNNDSFYNMVITKGNTTGEVVPYFEGMTSVENPKVRTPIVINGLLSTAQGKWESNSNFGGSVVYVPMIDVKVGQKYIIASSSKIAVAVWRSKTWVNNDVTQIEYADVLPDRPLIFTPDVSQVAIFMVVAKHLTDKAHEVELRMYEGEVDYGYLGRVENPKVIIERSTVSYTDLKLCSLPNGVKDTINVVTGEYIQRVGEREYQDGDLTNENVLTDGINTMYELENYIITKLDTQTLLAYEDGTINLSSDTGLLPTTHYAVPSTNTFHLSSMKTGTRYTLKYPSASGSITIGDITYKISSDSMLFTTPLKINGDTSAITFSDANPENVVLLEGAYNKREVPFFTGVKSVKNPNITIIDQQSTESTTYNCETEIELRGLPNGVADKLDIIKGKLTTNVGIRPYQEGDENLPNTWTDGYETVYALSSPIVTSVNIDHPTVTTNSLIELSSDYLIPQLNYRAPSSNNFPLDLLQPNQTYTLYADTLVSGSYTLGGTKTGVYSQPHIITLGDMTDNLLTFNGDLGLSNVMLVKGNSLKTTLPPYFLGIRSVTDGHLLVEGMAGEMNEITFDEGIVLRDCNGVKDSIDLITCTLTKRTGEITLTGAEGWGILPSTTINDDLQAFALTLSGINSSINNGLVCDKFIHRHMSGKLQDTEVIYSTNNQLILVVKKSRIGGDTVNALKSWLNQNPTTVVYPLITQLEIPLENVWTTTPPTSYDNQTEISSTVSSTSLKPMISVTVATTTLEQIVSNLEAQNEELENENVATMLALTNIYETFAMPMAINETSTIDLSDGKDGNKLTGMSISPMGMIYTKLIKKGYKTIEQVPSNLQAEVKYALKGLE